MMQSLDKDLRSALEKTVKAARAVAETAANAAVDQLGVGQDKPEAFLSDSEKALRNRLRTHGKQLGDARDSKSTNPTYGKQEVQHLMQEVAYEHWHRMLFARFLADNNLLMYDGVAVTIEECDELAADEGVKSGWELAGKLAARMLPQVFKPGSPVFELTFAPEHQSELEQLLKALPEAVFKASDSLGWVYQFWQADNKERINKSEVKIGADELPAVTQLFTEPYMVSFLLHNSLGGWWATRHPGKPCPVNLDYFRTMDDETPAAGNFEGWPDSLADFKLLDPCCGSGHFLVAAFLMLVPIRIAAEGLSAKEAVNRVLAENIHGLELDPRCVEIAVFAVALEAWRYSDASGKPLGVREIPAPNIACCGLKVAAKAQDWESLVPDEATNAEYVRQELRQLHASFSDAPLLGSLLDPSRSLMNDLVTSNFVTLTSLLHKALETEGPSNQLAEDVNRWESALSAQGLLKAANLLSDRYHLVITNVPYLGGVKQTPSLRDYCETNYPDSKYDLATVFMERCLELCLSQENGVVQIVMPQNWMFLGSYERLRIKLLKNHQWLNLVSLGDRSFQTPLGVAPILFSISSRASSSGCFTAISVTDQKSVTEKSSAIRDVAFASFTNSNQLINPNSRIILSSDVASGIPLKNIASALKGCSVGDLPWFVRNFWEVPKVDSQWEFHQGTPSTTTNFGGREEIIFWEQEKGAMYRLAQSVRHLNHAAQNWLRGKPNWGKKGIVISLMGNIPVTIYGGDRYAATCTTLVLNNQEDSDALLALWVFCSSDDFILELKKLSQKISTEVKTILEVPFDKQHWSQIASERYPNGLPKPFSNNPTQWIFHGHPVVATDSLQVAVARLVGYTWPAEYDDKMELSVEARDLVMSSRSLNSHVDKDGIVCIPPVGRESPASDRLLNLLADAYGDDWSNEVLAQLLTAAGHSGKSLDTWLRDKFFAQHCALFGNRPFVWHVWDGLRDGFAALVNYHKLDYKALEALIYTYLGDWISRQKRDADSRVDGAQEKLAAAEALKKRLELILSGEAPYDIFVRWKPIEEQPIGWNPDLNDGVRLNIRPFLSVPDVGKRGAGVLREKPKSLHWDKDRGSDIQSAPWYELGLMYDGNVGDRINDHHLSLDDKRKAREKAK